MGAFPWLLLTCALCLVYEAACVPEGPENSTRNVQQETSHARFQVFEGRKKTPPTVTVGSTSTGPKRKPQTMPVGNILGPLSALQSDDNRKGRGKKKKVAMQMKMLMTVKMIILGILIPKLIGIAIFASWKGITISLISLAFAIMAILKAQTPQSGGHGEKSIHVLVKKEDGKQHHEHWWRRIREAEPTFIESDDHDHHKGPYSAWEMEYH